MRSPLASHAPDPLATGRVPDSATMSTTHDIVESTDYMWCPWDIANDTLSDNLIGRLSAGIEHVAEKGPAHALGAEYLLSRVEEPKLVLGAADSNVETLSGRPVCEDANFMLSGGRDHAEEHDVALVTLEGVGIAASQASLHKHLGIDLVVEHTIDEPCLRLALETDHSHGPASVPRTTWRAGVRTWNWWWWEGGCAGTRLAITHGGGGVRPDVGLPAPIATENRDDTARQIRRRSPIGRPTRRRPARRTVRCPAAGALVSRASNSATGFGLLDAVRACHGGPEGDAATASHRIPDRSPGRLGPGIRPRIRRCRAGGGDGRPVVRFVGRNVTGRAPTSYHRADHPRADRAERSRCSGSGGHIGGSAGPAGPGAGSSGAVGGRGGWRTRAKGMLSGEVVPGHVLRDRARRDGCAPRCGRERRPGSAVGGSSGRGRSVGRGGGDRAGACRRVTVGPGPAPAGLCGTIPMRSGAFRRARRCRPKGAGRMGDRGARTTPITPRNARYGRLWPTGQDSQESVRSVLHEIEKPLTFRRKQRPTR